MQHRMHKGTAVHLPALPENLVDVLTELLHRLAGVRMVDAAVTRPNKWPPNAAL